MIANDLRETLEKAAALIIETSVRETLSGNWITYADEIPNEIISPELYQKHINDIVMIMTEHDAVADIAVSPDGTVDMCLYLAYCPNYEHSEDEQDTKPTLVERLEEGKRKAAQHEKPEIINNNRKQGLRE